ncbi:pyridoxal-phosphate dependent enzyme [Allorhizobium undicola]|uniref:pyridoxal-phosphate dependent enzyme n=1 Tax=Allorhizobium undicola TaxID=78527 RepID=UPI003D33B185
MPDLVRLGPNFFVARFETMKVYSALAAVEALLREGKINSQTTLIDSSSGIYAYALALACHRFGLKCHIVGSLTVDKTLLLQMKALGATVEQVKTAGTLKLDQNKRVERVRELLAANPDYYWMRQYHDDVHYLGYRPIANHIARLLGQDRLCLIGSVGSGCSTGGLTEAFREQGIDVRLIGVQPFGSVTFGSEHVDDPGIIIAGIGSSIAFDNVRPELYDELHWVSFDYGASGAISLLKNHAIFAGLSSGCCYLVAAREAALHPDRTILFVAPDTGHRYVEDVFTYQAEALPIAQLYPKCITDQQALSLPWACMNWGRRSFEVRQ